MTIRQERVSLAVDGHPAVRAMAQRSLRLRVVDDSSAAAAVVTDQFEVASEMASNGKHVLFLEPFSLDLESRGALSQLGRVLPVLADRFRPSIQQVKSAVGLSKLGEVGLVRVHRWGQAIADAAERDLALCRELDLILWLSGGAAQEVCAVQRGEYLQVHLGFDGGAMAMLDLDGGGQKGNEYYSLSVIGSTGAAYADDHHNMNLLMGSGGTRALCTSQGDVAYLAMLDDFAQRMTAADDYASAWREVESVMRIAERVHLSAKDERVVLGGAD